MNIKHTRNAAATGTPTSIAVLASGCDLGSGLEAGLGASADAETGSRASTEPCSTVSALTGFDPARKEDIFQVRLDVIRRRAALEVGESATKALSWLYTYGLGHLNGSVYGDDCDGNGEAHPYVEDARKQFAKRIYDHAVNLALTDVEKTYALAIEAAEAGETRSGSTVGKSAGRDSDNAQGGVR